MEGAILDGFRKLSAVPRRIHEKLSASAGHAPRAQGSDRDPERLLAKHLAGIATAQATGVLMQPCMDTQGELVAVRQDRRRRGALAPRDARIDRTRHRNPSLGQR